MLTTLSSFQLRNGALSYTHFITNRPNDQQHRSYMLDYYEIYYLISGSINYQVEGESYHLNPGDLLILNNKEVHRPFFRSEDSYERILLFFKPELCRPYCSPDYDLLHLFERKKPGKFNRIPCELTDKSRLLKYFKDMEVLSSRDLPQNPLLIELTFIQMLVYINEILSANPNTFDLKFEYHEKLEQIIQYVNENLNRNISLHEIELTFHVNKYYFSHLFKKITGVSYKQYVINKRLSKAAELLKLSVPPAEAAQMTGFDDYSNFYKAFKKMTGLSPSRYKS
ncbi:helix-turn-helix domain-containing protein [Paenibacillus sp. NPDC056579]|uniref:helix-turn-helix domain-containing protein n=1 Tax=Paenibacillus sp. NPDC056579 TaxID=3345871 RepID=UPI0036A64BD6